MNPRIGLIVVFEGDFRTVAATIKNVDIFTGVSGNLYRGDLNVTSAYVSGSVGYAGNVFISGVIGGVTTIPQGSYRYFMTAIYGGKVRSWYWDIISLPQDLSILAARDLSIEDYNPFVEELTIYENDKFSKDLVLPGAEFTAVTGKLRLDSQDVTATYCSGTPSALGDTLTTHIIGGGGALPAGLYGYFLTGTYLDGTAKSTWYWKLRVLPKQGVL